MKKCTFCAEEIQDDAIKCKHCGSDLGKQSTQTGEVLGQLMLLVPFISTILIWFWVGNMALIQRPMSILNFIGIGTVVLTALFSYFEASKLGFGSKEKETKPIMYFIGMVLLWIIVFPLYLFQRSKKGKKNLVVGGIIIAIIFAGSYFLMSSSITAGVNEILDILR